MTNRKGHTLSAPTSLDFDDKKCNKLGYIRTSVACAPCRRRKIRCLITPGAFQHRCKNCTRLKKECAFQPPGQQNNIAGRSHTSSSADAGSIPTPLIPPSYELSSGKLLQRSDESEMFSASPSMAPPLIKSIPPDSEHMLPGIPARGASDYEIGTVPSSGFLQTNFNDHAHRKQYADFATSSGGSLTRPDGCLHCARMSSPTIPWEDCVLSPNINAALPALAHHNTSTTYPSPTMTSALSYPFVFESQAPVSTTSITAAQNSQKPWPSEILSCLNPDQEQWDSKRVWTKDVAAKLKGGCSCYLEGFSLALKLEGGLYKRRSKRRSHRKLAMEAKILDNRRPISIPSAHIRAPRNAVDRSPSSSRFVKSYLAFLRAHLSLGWPEDIILGPKRVNADRLFQDNFTETVAPTLSSWIAQIISKFELLGVPEKLGLMVLYSRSFKWLVTQSLHDYHQVPAWIRPTPIQISLEHEMWIDLVLWPDARDALIKLPYAIDDIYEALSHVSGDLFLAWPFSPGDLIDVDPCTETSYASPLFEQYALDLQNWALPPVVALLYPLLVGRVRVLDT